jgi:hypothetical protein
MTAQFDLEEHIMSAWTTEDDLKLLIHTYDSLDEDQRLNALIGIQQMHSMRMNRVFLTFEVFLKEYYRARKTSADPQDIANEN